MESYLIFGSGGHAKVVLECLISEKKQVVGFFDDNPLASEFKNIKPLNRYDATIEPNAKLVVTIGNNKIRKSITERTTHHFGRAIHATALVSPSAIIGDGCMVLHKSIIQSDATLGKHAIINTNAVVEHDCLIGQYVHIAPGAVVCGNVEIGEGTLVGANAVIAPNIKIGKWCLISAGSSVLNDVPDFSLVQGVPGIVQQAEH